MHTRPIAAFLALAATVLCGCTTAQPINRADGGHDYVIGCGAGLGWNICYDRANELCPAGYTTASKVAGFDRKELTVSCPAPAPSARSVVDQCSYEASLATAAVAEDKAGVHAKLFEQCVMLRSAPVTP
jgi:hypothetical protein